MGFFKRFFRGRDERPRSVGSSPHLPDDVVNRVDELARRFVEQAMNDRSVDPGAMAQRLVDRPTGGDRLQPVRAWTEAELAKLESFEVRLPSGGGRCSDNECPCPPPGTEIPHGSGYLYIPPAAVEFRTNARTAEELEAKAERMRADYRERGVTFLQDPAIYKAILMCERGARRRLSISR
jgi:hypothetical protein